MLENYNAGNENVNTRPNHYSEEIELEIMVTLYTEHSEYIE